ncbi:uncharacterized protein LOC124493846 isoform X3 [Dermatophagoides farinae]|uniref:uncharacterized protein LOC124493846 isoform X3 n=1 Tax=Dermatophagoides farinae TaxID=6954 RepID=UPI003F5FFE0A
MRSSNVLCVCVYLRHDYHNHHQNRNIVANQIIKCQNHNNDHHHYQSDDFDQNFIHQQSSSSSLLLKFLSTKKQIPQSDSSNTTISTLLSQNSRQQKPQSNAKRKNRINDDDDDDHIEMMIYIHQNKYEMNNSDMKNNHNNNDNDHLNNDGSMIHDQTKHRIKRTLMLSKKQKHHQQQKAKTSSSTLPIVQRQTTLNNNNNNNKEFQIIINNNNKKEHENIKYKLPYKKRSKNKHLKSSSSSSSFSSSTISSSKMTKGTTIKTLNNDKRRNIRRSLQHNSNNIMNKSIIPSFRIEHHESQNDDNIEKHGSTNQELNKESNRKNTAMMMMKPPYVAIDDNNDDYGKMFSNQNINDNEFHGDNNQNEDYPLKNVNSSSSTLSIIKHSQQSSSSSKSMTIRRMNSIGHDDPEMKYQNITAQVGHPAYMPCIIDSLGDKMVSWIRLRDFHLLTIGTLTYIQDDRFVVRYGGYQSNDWILQIKHVTIKDEGLYECQINSDPPKSQYFYLHIVVPVTEIIGNPNIFVRLGESINLTCLITQSPEPPAFVFWYHNERMINYDYTETDDGRIIVQKSAEQNDVIISRLMINKAKLDSSGNYTCTPSNAEPASTYVHVLQGEKRLSNDVQNDWNQQTLDMTITTQQKSATNSEGHHSGSISTTIYHHHHHQRRLSCYIITIFDSGIVIIIISIISMLNEFLFLQY